MGVITQLLLIAFAMLTVYYSGTIFQPLDARIEAHNSYYNGSPPTKRLCISLRSASEPDSVHRVVHSRKLFT